MKFDTNGGGEIVPKFNWGNIEGYNKTHILLPKR